MPIYNGIEFIEESVSTIRYQTYANWELIIGINGHPPDSEVYQIAKKSNFISLRFLPLKSKLPSFVLDRSAP